MGRLQERSKESTLGRFRSDTPRYAFDVLVKNLEGNIISDTEANLTLLFLHHLNKETIFAWMQWDEAQKARPARGSAHHSLQI
jgi:hypothetical protein